MFGQHVSVVWAGLESSCFLANSRSEKLGGKGGLIALSAGLRCRNKPQASERARSIIVSSHGFGSFVVGQLRIGALCSASAPMRTRQRSAPIVAHRTRASERTNHLCQTRPAAKLQPVHETGNLNLAQLELLVFVLLAAVCV